MNAWPKKVIFVSTWVYGSALYRSSLQPNIRLMRELLPDRQVMVVCYSSESSETDDDVKLFPVTRSSDKGGVGRVAESAAWSRAVDQIRNHATENSLIVARGTPAGWYGLQMRRGRRSNRLLVESCEPHRAYMVESESWARWGLKSLVSAVRERRVLQAADHICTVSPTYTQQLMPRLTAAQTIHEVPCVSNLPDCAMSSRDLQMARARHVHFLYIGKHGGMYEDSGTIIQAATWLLHHSEGSARFTWLCPDSDEVLSWLRDRIPGTFQSRFVIARAPHDDVPTFLQAATVGVNFLRDIPSLRHSSPIKHAEYWQYGLFTICSRYAGPEAELLEDAGVGLPVDFHSEADVKRVAQEIAAKPFDAEAIDRIREFGQKSRPIFNQRQVYEQLLQRD